jgi:hypothetical protein
MSTTARLAAASADRHMARGSSLETVQRKPFCQIEFQRLHIHRRMLQLPLFTTAGGLTPFLLGRRSKRPSLTASCTLCGAEPRICGHCLKTCSMTCNAPSFAERTSAPTVIRQGSSPWDRLLRRSWLRRSRSPAPNVVRRVLVDRAPRVSRRRVGDQTTSGVGVTKPPLGRRELKVRIDQQRSIDLFHCRGCVEAEFCILRRTMTHLCPT